MRLYLDKSTLPSHSRISENLACEAEFPRPTSGSNQEILSDSDNVLCNLPSITVDILRVYLLTYLLLQSHRSGYILYPYYAMLYGSVSLSFYGMMRMLFGHKTMW